MSAGDVIGYYTSERYALEHISAIVERTGFEWNAGRPLCRSVHPKAVFASKEPGERRPLVELRAIVDTTPRLAFIRCPRCQAIAERLLQTTPTDARTPEVESEEGR